MHSRWAWISTYFWHICYWCQWTFDNFLKKLTLWLSGLVRFLPHQSNHEAWVLIQGKMCWIKSGTLDDTLEAERRWTHALNTLWINYTMLKQAIFLVLASQVGATSGQGREGPPPPPPRLSGISADNPVNVSIVNEYNSFNLTNVTPPVAPKWKQTDTLLDEFLQVSTCSCQRIFDGLMCYIISSKVKTSMLLIWANLDGEDKYESFNLLPHQKYDVNYVSTEVWGILWANLQL